MRAGTIWWGQIGNAIRALDELAEHMQDHRSAVIRVPERLCWRQDFYEARDIRRTLYGGGRSIRQIEWCSGDDPGELILQELCPPQVRAAWWPGQHCADYLSGREDLALNEYDVYITGVTEKADLAKWVEFITRYGASGAAPETRAVFLVEYAGPDMDTGPVSQIDCTVEDHDCRVFCLEAAAVLKNAQLREYQAELALRIGGRDPELCWALLKTGEALLRDPAAAARTVAEEALDSTFRPFRVPAEQAVLSAAWRAALVLFLPLVEQWRTDFIVRNADELRRHLPITNSNGERVTEPEDLEVGNLYYIRKNKVGCKFSQQDREKIDLCRHVRNLLAHNKLICTEDAQRIMLL